VQKGGFGTTAGEGQGDWKLREMAVQVPQACGCELDSAMVGGVVLSSGMNWAVFCEAMLGGRGGGGDSGGGGGGSGGYVRS
jgi:hypothetical protein